jgi:hypothetical protein
MTSAQTQPHHSRTNFSDPGIFAAAAEHSGFSVTDAGPHHRQWTRILTITNDSGAIQVTNSFREISTGLNRWTSNGWTEATPQLTADTNGITASGAQNSALFAPNLNMQGSVQIQMSNGEWLKVHPLALAYHDRATGSNVYFASLKDSAPILVGSNRVVYPDAFDGGPELTASVSYTFTKSGVSQDIRFQSRPVSPASLGLNETNVHLVAITEVMEGPTPEITDQSWTDGGEVMLDQTLNFGPMKMVPGRAFKGSARRRDRGVRVGKTYETTSDGRKLIVERLRYREIKRDLLQLPLVSTNSMSGATNAAVRKSTKWFAKNSLPAQPQKRPLVAAVSKPQYFASIDDSRDFVIDWNDVYSGDDFFAGCGETSVIHGECTFNTMEAEGQAVVKYMDDASIEVLGEFIWHPVGGCWFGPMVMTSVRDNDNGGDDVADALGLMDPPYDGIYGPALLFDDCSNLQVAQDNTQIFYAYDPIIALCTPSVEITATDVLATKGASPTDDATFTITRTEGDWRDPLTVYLALSGDAAGGTSGSGDYDALPDSVDIPTAQGSVTVTIHAHSPLGDTFEKKVIVGINSDISYTIGANSSAQAYIEDPSTPVGPAVTAPSGLISWWRGENNLDDVMGKNQGSQQNGMDFTTGFVGSGFNFDGWDHRFLATDSASLNFASGADYTIEAWIQPITASSYYGVQSIVDKRYAPNDWTATGYTLHLINGQLGCQISVGGSINNYGAAGPDLRDGRFHHVAVTVHRGSSGGHLYVDGQNVLTFTPPTGDLSNTEPFRIGNHATPGVNAFFSGVIDEVSLYNRALTAGEISGIHSASRGGKIIPPPAIMVQPAGQTASAGSPITFSVVATGYEPLSYQWKTNGVLIPGATGSSFSIPSVSHSDVGVFTVDVSNPGGVTSSDPAGLTVCWGGATVYKDQLGTILGGLPILTDGWQLFNIVGEGDLHQTYDSPRMIVGCEFILATGFFTDNGTTIQQNVPPTGCELSAFSPPGTPAVIGNASFDAAAWSGFPDRGAVSPYETEYANFHVTLPPDPFYYSDYSFHITGTCSGLFRPIERVFTTQQGCDVPPSITVQPLDQVTCSGTPVTFAVRGTSSLPMRYQWQFNGADIPAATDSSLVIPSSSASSSGGYAVWITNAFGAVRSRQAQLTFGDVPIVSIKSIADAERPCTPGGFRVDRTCGTAPITIHYTIGGTAINGTDYETLGGTLQMGAGETSASLTVQPVSNGKTDQQTVILTLLANTGYTLGSSAPAAISLGPDSSAIRSGFSSSSLPAGDDNSTKASIGFPINIGGSSLETDLFVNVDGIISFGTDLTEWYMTPSLCGLNNVISPFWADMYTVGATLDPTPGVVFGPGIVEGHPAFGVLWDAMPGDAVDPLKRNTFQLVLIDRSDVALGDFDCEFNYWSIEWESSGNSDGDNPYESNGTGGVPGRAGYSLNDDCYELPGSGVLGALPDSNLGTGLRYRSLGTCKPGRFIFQFRNGRAVRMPAVVLEPSTAPVPASVTMSVPGHPHAAIRYTVDGTTPTASSPVYHYPVSVTENTGIKAYATEPGLADGPVSLGVYGNAAPCFEGCVAWWSAEDNAEDRLGLHNGACLYPHGSAPAFGEGKVGRAFSFGPPPGGPPISVLDDWLLAIPDNLTVEGWIKVTDATARGFVIHRFQEYVISTEPLDSTHCYLRFRGHDDNTYAQATIVAGSQADWIHFAATAEPDPAGSYLSLTKLYINGELADQQLVGDGGFAATWPAGFLGIGSDPTGNDKFVGLIDELAIYSRTLRPVDVKWIYLAGSNGKLPVTPAVSTPIQIQLGLWNGGQILSSDQFAFWPGASVDLVAFSQGSDLGYQWFRNGVHFADSQLPTLTLDNISQADEGFYQVAVANSSGLAQPSLWTYLALSDWVTITTQPSNQSAGQGGSATFQVVTGGRQPQTFQWYYDDTNAEYAIDGATNSSLVLNNITSDDEGAYQVLVSNGSSYDPTHSDLAYLTVVADVAPSITSQPQDQTALAGTSVTISAVVAGTPPFTYQWQYNDIDIVGATSSAFSMPSAQVASNGTYRVIVSNLGGTATSDEMTLTVCNPVPPVIARQPASVRALVGSSVTFTAPATGYPTPSFQWNKNGIPISGATQTAYRLDHIGVAQAGTYSATIQNTYGTTVSDNATLTVPVVPLPPVTIMRTGSAALPSTVTMEVVGYAATIYYTDDGTLPSTSSYQYTGPLNVTSKKTISALAVKADFLPSEITSVTVGDSSAATAAEDIYQIDLADGSTDLRVTDNDDNPSGAPLAVSVLQQPRHGAAMANGTVIVYTPDGSGFFGIDSFTYQITDFWGNSSAASVTLFVNKPENNPPLSTTEPFGRLSNMILTLPVSPRQIAIQSQDVMALVTDADNDPVLIYSARPPSKGTVTDSIQDQFGYLRAPDQFGQDTIQYVVADARGGFDTGTIVINDADADNNGIPDAWEAAHALATPVDPNADLEPDGLPNWAEYALRCDPQVADNPLNLPNLEMKSGFLDVPLSLAHDPDPNVTFLVMVDGNPVTEPDAKVSKNANDGLWHLQLNPVFTSGDHTIVLGISFASDLDGNAQTLFGNQATLSVSAPVTLTTFQATFNGGLEIAGNVNVSADTFSLQIVNQAGTVVKSITGSVTSGSFDATWDLTDGAGNLAGVGPLTCNLNFPAETPGSSGGGSSSSAVARVTPLPCKCGEDVTDLVYSSLINVIKTYNNASIFRQFIANTELTSILTAADSWDMVWLKKDYRTDNWAGRGCQKCFNTVTFEGKCVRLDELNFMMFGCGCALNSVGPPVGMTLKAWIGLLVRSFLPQSIFGFSDSVEVTDRKIGFAIYGTGYLGKMPDNLRWPQSCVPQPKVFPKAKLDRKRWFWKGLKSEAEMDEQNPR